MEKRSKQGHDHTETIVNCLEASSSEVRNRVSIISMFNKLTDHFLSDFKTKSSYKHGSQILSSQYAFR